jgi:histidine decarboxylase
MLNGYRRRRLNNRQLNELLQRLDADRPTNIGFPGARDLHYSRLAPFLDRLLNNVGDPYVQAGGGDHTKELEREVAATFADLFRAPADDRWGYVTTGGTEGNLYGLYLARSRFPNGVVYASQASHSSVAKATRLLAMPTETVRSTSSGEVDYDHLSALIAAAGDRPAIVVANIGTTMTEAVDDVARISAILDERGVVDRHIHSDAALAGLPLALLPTRNRPGFDLADGADSLTVSGHKFLGSPFPCGVVLTRRSLADAIGAGLSCTGGPDTTITGSRSGHAALVLWYALYRHGLDGLRSRAAMCRLLAEATTRRLNSIGWPAWRNPRAFTVVLKTPPPAVTSRWTLATANGWSHLICMPGVSTRQIDAFIRDLAACNGREWASAAAPWSTMPAPATHVPGMKGRHRGRPTDIGSTRIDTRFAGVATHDRARAIRNDFQDWS